MSTALSPAVVEWVGRVRPHLDTAAEGIISAGRELVAAKDALPHGAFGRLLEELHLTPRTAQRFMAIARHPVLANTTHVSYLPSAWSTLYELSRVPAEVLEAAIETGEVSPGMRREDVQALAARSTSTEELVDPRLHALNEGIRLLGSALAILESGRIPQEKTVAAFSEVRDFGRQAQEVARQLTEEYESQLAGLQGDEGSNL